MICSLKKAKVFVMSEFERRAGESNSSPVRDDRGYKSPYCRQADTLRK
jgi:hypothetical protein